MKKSKNILVVFSAIIFGLALSGCQNPFLQLGKEAISSASSPFVQSPIPGAVVYQDGTEEYPFLVYDVETLGMVGSGKTLDGINYWNLDQQYIQIENIDLSDEDDWQPIGLGSQFSGSYKGNGHSISNLSMSGVDYIGLFSKIDVFGKVVGIRLIDATIEGSRNVGGIAGRNDGEILDCSFTGRISTTDKHLGGMAGWNLGTVERCSAEGHFNGTESIGGMVGSSDGKVINCYAVGNFNGNYFIGGIAGQNSAQGQILGCYAAGSFSDTYDIGGIAGYDIGGIAGLSRGSVKNCYSTGTCGSAASTNVGGLVGLIGDGELASSYSTCEIQGADIIGGLAGSISKGQIRDCAALSDSVTSPSVNVGRITGDYASGYTSIQNNYASLGGMDAIISSHLEMDGIDVAESDWIYESWWTTFADWSSDDAWDFETIWEWGLDDLPILRGVGGQ